MLTIHAICQPYVNRVHNIIDTLLLSNLLIITSLTYYNYFRSYVQRRLRQGVTISPAIVQLILMHLPTICRNVGVFSSQGACVLMQVWM